jgi:hypothetical protein
MSILKLFACVVPRVDSASMDRGATRQETGEREPRFGSSTSRRPHNRAMSLLAVLKPNRIIHKRTDANCNNFHLRVFLGLSNP